MAVDPDELVHAEQVKAVYGQTMTAVVSNPLACLMLVWIFRNVIEQQILFVWLICSTLVSVMRVFHTWCSPDVIMMRNRFDALETSLSFWPSCRDPSGELPG